MQVITNKPEYVIGPDGYKLTLENLPAPTTLRWVIRRKAQVVCAVRGGLLTLEQACEHYHLSKEEFHSWQKLIDQHGISGLRVTKSRYRDSLKQN